MIQEVFLLSSFLLSYLLYEVVLHQFHYQLLIKSFRTPLIPIKSLLSDQTGLGDNTFYISGVLTFYNQIFSSIFRSWFSVTVHDMILDWETFLNFSLICYF